MWKVLLVAYLAVCVAETAYRSSLPFRCNLPMNIGLGIFPFRRFYFNAAAGECKKFPYYGLFGNRNRFRTLKHCKRVCLGNGTPSNATSTITRAAPDATERCTLKVDRGPCRGLLMRFYFDNETGTCKTFNYGGCSGNANNFESQSSCEEACLKN